MAMFGKGQWWYSKSLNTAVEVLHGRETKNGINTDLGYTPSDDLVSIASCIKDGTVLYYSKPRMEVD